VITEQGKVVAVESDGVWVETANQSACSRCVARKGCGQSLLAQVDGHRSYIKAAFNDYEARDFQEGQVVEIGIHESAVTRGSFLVYCLPLLGLVMGAGVGDALGVPEVGVAAFSAFGLMMSGLGVRWFSRRTSIDARYQPVVVNMNLQADSVVIQELEAGNL
jgi:sigma-E factor negative regulatory protein RseC